MKDYDYVFEIVVNLIKKIKRQNYMLGKYFEENIIYDTTSGTIQYNGIEIRKISMHVIIKDTDTPL